MIAERCEPAVHHDFRRFDEFGFKLRAEAGAGCGERSAKSERRERIVDSLSRSLVLQCFLEEKLTYRRLGEHPPRLRLFARPDGEVTDELISADAENARHRLLFVDSLRVEVHEIERRIGAEPLDDVLVHPVALRVRLRSVSRFFRPDKGDIDLVHVEEGVVGQGADQQFACLIVARPAFQIHRSSFGEPVRDAVVCARQCDGVDVFMAKHAHPVVRSGVVDADLGSLHRDDRPGGCSDGVNRRHSCDPHGKPTVIGHEFDHGLATRLVLDRAGDDGVIALQWLEHFISHYFVDAGLVADNEMGAFNGLIRQQFFDERQTVDRARLEGVKLDDPAERIKCLLIASGLQLQQSKLDEWRGPVGRQL